MNADGDEVGDSRAKLFTVRGHLKPPLDTLLTPLLDRLLALDGLSAIYRDAIRQNECLPFSDKVLEAMGVRYEVDEKDLARIPESGPVVVVANHCYGGLEGIIMASLLGSVRDDVKIMANYMLAAIPEMRPLFIFVDPFGGADAAKKNLTPIKQSMQWLKDGRMLGTFPSGEVAHLELRRRGIVEPPWSPTIGGLIRRTGAAVVPVYFDGTNSLFFHLAGILHPRLRTALLPRQLCNKKGATVPVHVGNAIPFSKLEKQGDVMDYLRMRTYNLGRRNTTYVPGIKLTLPGISKRSKKTDLLPPEPIIEAVPPELLEKELHALPADRMLVEMGPLSAWFGRAHEIPCLLREIGRLREVTFREVGEGTGKAIDLDKYDQYYLHLLIWQKEAREVVAAYRLGPTDEILPVSGKRGLYTNSLFRYRSALLREISPALEMGRTFVRKEYQRSFQPLMLLWKGIARFIAMYPRYKILFGPVSINGNYKTSSQQLLVAFLKDNNFVPDLARLVKARMPLRKTRINNLYTREYTRVVENLGEVESLISDIETELQGVPILLKQYLRLGGKLLGFNVDPDFNYVLDGLILVDITQTDRKVMLHYFGEEAMKKFLAYHGLTE